APAKISEAKIIDEEKKIIAVKVKPDQLSLAIGRAGQNVRLAAKLTGWNIEIEEEKEEKKEAAKEKNEREQKIEKSNET
ncbi:MAG: transcription termination/antitermination protein NusA, partial [Patescibacteria group bacterium]|nr:transcription termination/antitermination protein NusA [Patescibacteria group bacterium]